MRGSHTIHVFNRRVDYQIEVHRSITILQGDSGTGKTTLYEMVADHTRLGGASGIQVSCDKRCVALVDLDWRNQLASVHDSIVFVDEDADYIRSNEFASFVRRTDNYYLIITRESLYALPYSIKEVYEFSTSGKYHTLKRVYEEGQGHTYGASRTAADQGFMTMLVEDSHSGLQFFQHRFSKNGPRCESSNGNAGIYGWLMNHSEERVFVLADGAAFGAEAQRVLDLQQERRGAMVVCLPESFEWLLLSSGVVHGVQDVVDDSGKCIESSEHFSWEQFFTQFLREVTRGTPFEYSKERIASAYLVDKNADMIMASITNGNVR